ncbi:unnamed protein product [Bemisia tabaci]|uniref:Uncharacterized protein n=1 Tax=Bemisia tabaci TaxID=7038 RepID=A0A9P0AAM9_BEMTA|nr:unnamed protein product [Bemisia tabaci]
MSANEKLGYWRGIYELITELKGEVDPKFIKFELEKIEKQLLEGTNWFDVCTENRKKVEANNDTSKKMSVDNLISHLALLLNVEHAKCWDIFLNYIMHSFRGTESKLQEMVKVDKSRNEIIQGVFFFYYSERLFLLKTLKHIVKNYFDANHKYQDVYKSLIDKLKPAEIYKSLMSQLAKIQSVPLPIKLTHGSLLTNSRKSLWVQHCFAEQIEILNILIMIVPIVDIKLANVLQWIQTVKESDFGSVQQRRCDDEQSLSQLKTITLTEVLLTLQLFSYSWDAESGFWSNEMEVFNKLEEQMKNLKQGAESGPLVLAWMLMNRLGPYGYKDEKTLSFFATIANRLQPWDFLNQILLCPNFQDDSFLETIVSVTVYELTHLCCTNFGPAVFGNDKAVYQLLSNLAKHKTVQDDIWEKGNKGLMQLLHDLEVFYPISVADLLLVLIPFCSSKERCDTIVEMMDKQMLYYTSESVMLSQTESQEWVNSFDFHPLAFVQQVCIPKGTKCKRIEGNFRWDYTISFWHIMTDYLRNYVRVCSTAVHHTIHQDLRRKVLMYLKFTCTFMKYSIDTSHVFLAALDEMLILLSKIPFTEKTVDIEIITACLQLYTEAVAVFPQRIVALCSDLPVFPKCERGGMNYISCATAQSLTKIGSLMSVCDSAGLSHGDHSIFIAYLNLLIALYKFPETRTSQPVLCGLMYLLNCSFPQFKKWYYKKEEDYRQVEWLFYEFFHEILQTPNDDKSVMKMETSPSKADVAESSLVITEQFLRHVLLYSLLHKIPGSVLVDTACSGEQVLFSYLVTKPSWTGGLGRLVVRTVEHALDVFNQVLSFKRLDLENSQLAPIEEDLFETKLWKRSFRLLQITSYIHNSFSPHLRQISLKVLSKLADNRSISFLTCLGLDPVAVRKVFLEPLFAENEPDGIKAYLVRFITSCVRNQSSMTEAFVNASAVLSAVKDTNQQDKNEDGILPFLTSYLKKIDEETCSSILCLETVRLLQELWKSHRSLPVHYLKKQKGFWFFLFKPLFFKPKMKLKPLYATIMNILSQELFIGSKDNVDEELSRFLKSFFQDDSTITAWNEFCLGLIGEDSEDPLQVKVKMDLVKEWRNLLACISGSHPSFINDSVWPKVALSFLESLSQYNIQTDTVEVRYIVEAYLLLMKNLKKNSLIQFESGLKEFAKIFPMVVMQFYYTKIETRAILLVLSNQVIKSSSMQKSLTKEEEECLEMILKNVFLLLSKQLHEVECKSLAPEEDIIFLLLLSHALSIENSQLPNCKSHWQSLVEKYDLFNRLVSLLKLLLKTKKKIKTIGLMVGFLIKTAELSNINLVLDVEHFTVSLWDCIMPDDSVISDKLIAEATDVHSSLFKGHFWNANYSQILSLVAVLLEKGDYKVKSSLLNDLIIFQVPYIIEAQKLVKCSIFENDLLLVSRIFILLREIALVRDIWPKSLCEGLTKCFIQMRQSFSSIVEILVSPEALLSLVTGDYYSVDRFIGFCQTMQMLEKTLPEEIDTSLKSTQARLLSLLLYCTATLNLFGTETIELIDCLQTSIPVTEAHQLYPNCPVTMPPYNDLLMFEDFHSVYHALSAISAGYSKRLKINVHFMSSSLLPCETSFLPDISNSDVTTLQLLVEMLVSLIIKIVLLVSLDPAIDKKNTQHFIRELNCEVAGFIDFATRYNWDESLKNKCSVFEEYFFTETREASTENAAILQAKQTCLDSLRRHRSMSRTILAWKSAEKSNQKPQLRSPGSSTKFSEPRQTSPNSQILTRSVASSVSEEPSTSKGVHLVEESTEMEEDQVEKIEMVDSRRKSIKRDEQSDAAEHFLAVSKAFFCSAKSQNISYFDVAIKCLEIIFLNGESLFDPKRKEVSPPHNLSRSDSEESLNESYGSVTPFSKPIQRLLDERGNTWTRHLIFDSTNQSSIRDTTGRAYKYVYDLERRGVDSFQSPGTHLDKGTNPMSSVASESGLFSSKYHSSLM